MSDTKTCTERDDDRYYEEQIAKAADPNAVLDSSLDVDALVANMAELAALAPSWRDHVSHDVALQFNANAEYQRKYGPHVDSCALCQKLIETVGLPDETLQRLKDSVRVSLREALEELVRQLFGAASHPIPVPTAAFVESLDAPMPIPMLQRLRAAEHSENPLDQFGAVETYFRLHRPELAYGLLARGLERCGLEHKIAIRIGNAPHFEAEGVEYLIDLSREQEHLEAGDPIRAIEVFAQLGDHAAALRQVRRVIKVSGLKGHAAVKAASELG